MHGQAGRRSHRLSRISYLAEAKFELAASRQVYGRAIPFVLLMHIGAFDARMLPRLLDEYKDETFSFVSLDAAEQDAFHATDLRPADPPGPANLQAAARQKALSLLRIRHDHPKI